MTNMDERSATYRERLTSDFQNSIRSALGGYTYGLHPGLPEILVDSAMGAVDALLDELVAASKTKYPIKPDVLRAAEAINRPSSRRQGYPW